MKRILFALLMIILLTSMISVFASPPPPSPTCYLEGTIQAVEFKDAYNEPCLYNCDRRGDAACCPTDMELRHPARYFLKIIIVSTAYISGSTEYSTCQNEFPQDTEVTIFIDKDKVLVGDSFQEGQKIAGQVSSGYLPYFDSYSLSAATDTLSVEAPESNTKIIIYISIAVSTVILVILLIYLLVRAKSNGNTPQQ